eukprot:1592116-Amphidinium_carterae.1
MKLKDRRHPVCMQDSLSIHGETHGSRVEIKRQDFNGMLIGLVTKLGGQSVRVVLGQRASLCVVKVSDSIGIAIARIRALSTHDGSRRSKLRATIIPRLRQECASAREQDETCGLVDAVASATSASRRWHKAAPVLNNHLANMGFKGRLLEHLGTETNSSAMRVQGAMNEQAVKAIVVGTITIASCERCIGHGGDG